MEAAPGSTWPKGLYAWEPGGEQGIGLGKGKAGQHWGPGAQKFPKHPLG